MPHLLLSTLLALGAVHGTASVAVPPAGAAAPTSRTVYVTVTDNKGGPIADLAPADLVVKEGGKEREIARVEPASARMHLTLGVEEVLIGDGATRMALFEFMKRIVSGADIRLVTMGLRNTTVADYTSDMNALVGAINNLTLNPNRDSNLGENILEVVAEYADKKPERPVLVVVALSGGQAGVEPRTVFDKLRESGATMHAVTLAGASAGGPVGSLVDQSGREQVLGDGPKQSGGRRLDLNTTEGFRNGLQQVASDLLSQYAITYTLPDGVKPDKRFGISSKRKGVSLRAPSQIPDR
jgi:hypothetical protein